MQKLETYLHVFIETWMLQDDVSQALVERLRFESKYDKSYHVSIPPTKTLSDASQEFCFLRIRYSELYYLSE